jgi:DNA polymerase V
MQTVLELRGQPCFATEMSPAPNKQIVRSRSFGRPIESLVELEQAVATHASRAAQKLRQQGLAAGMMSVFIMTNRFKANSPQYSNSATLQLAIPSDATDTLIACGLKGLARIYRKGFAYKKAGVMLMDLIPARGQQMNLFEVLQCPQSSRLDPVLDKINRRFGSNALRYAVMGFEQPWAMRREFCSPHYTTNWCDLPVART